MKLWICTLLLFSLVLRPLAPIVTYALNYKYIAEVLCVNKKRPALLCSGKCYIAKEVAKSLTTAPLSKNKTNVQKVIDFCNHTEKQLTSPPSVTKLLHKLHAKPHTNNYCFFFSSRLLKPPITSYFISTSATV